MKTLLIKLKFKLASWLYNQGIIAPQLLTKEDGSPVKNIRIMTDDVLILAPFNTKEEAEEARVKYGYGDDNYYVDKLIN
jgi:hypothetical protein